MSKIRTGAAGIRAWAGVLMLAAISAGNVWAARVTGVSPAGEVPEARQISVRFNEPVVNAGDPRLPPPMTLRCVGAVPTGDGRWLNAQQWVFDLREPLVAGARCTLQVAAGWKPLNGALEGATEFRFSTGAPSPVRIDPTTGSAIEEDQHFLLRLNGAVDLATLARGAWCEVEGLGERIPVKVVQGAPRDQVLRERRISQNLDRWLLLACDRMLPAEAGVRLVWGPGIAAAAMPQLVTTAPRVFAWKVRPRFTAEFSCERERAGVPCMPLRPLVLRFSAPVAREQALAARLVPAQGQAIAPKTPAVDAGPMITELQFAAPLPENTKFTITLPRELRDETGRALANAATFPLAVASAGMPPLAKFSAAPFGIVEAGPQALLPLTLRQVQADLKGASTGGSLRVRRLDTGTADAELLGWIARLNRYHEGELSAQEAGRPRGEWMVVETETDARGKTRQVRRERRIATRELSLLKADGDAKRSDLPQLNSSDGRSTEVIGVPLPQRGYHVVEVESRVLGHALLDKREPMYVRTGALVTNLAVHFKRGRSSSLVWVTTLDRGRPVPGARVVVNDCRGQSQWSGSTDAAGIARIDRGFDDEPARAGECLTSNGLFVTARFDDPKTGPDLGFAFSGWQRGIEPWRFNLPLATGPARDRVAHTVFDRTLLRAGETVSMKHFVREETERGLNVPAAESLPDSVVITHVGSGSETVQPLSWSAGARSAESRWEIPKSAKLGLYDVHLKRGDTRSSSGNVRVEAFRVPLVDARLAGPKGVIVAPEKLALSVQLNMLAGGPLARAPARVSALLRQTSPTFAGFDDFQFEPPRQRRPGADDDDSNDPSTARLVADKLDAGTDAQGAATVTLAKLPKIESPSELSAELTFNDPNGEVQTVAQRLRLWPSAVVVGLRARNWASTVKGEMRFDAVVLDTDGKPLKDREVEVIGRLQQTFSIRKRIVGGFYAYDHQSQSRELGTLCKGRSDAQGRLACEAKSDVVGQVELIARARDDAQRVSQAAASVYVAGDDEQWFEQSNDDRIDLAPEQRELEPGQTARIQVRMPFRTATALVSVEREGVVDARVMTISGRSPVIELPIPAATEGARSSGETVPAARSWAPNVIVSVLALRGRVREVPWTSFFGWGWRSPLDWWRAFRDEGPDWRAPTAMVDLAKPTFRLGATELKIGLALHRLDVKVVPEKTSYGVRETVRTRITVTQGGKPAANAELAFAAVDEGLLALRNNDSWLLLEGLMRRRSWGVETATALGEVIGRRHYGRKTAPPGGDGGANPTRELFDTLLLWRGRVALDANGQASIDVPLNDSLTSFRLVAVADAGADRFGTGSASVRVTQDLQLFSGLPPLVRDGDRLDAMFTLRNTTARAMNVKLVLTAQPAILLPEQTVSVPAGGAAELRWTVPVPAGVERIEWTAVAEETGGASSRARDRLKVTQAVQPAVPLRVWQASLQPLEGSVSLPFAPPADALAADAATPAGAKRGGVQIGLQRSLSGALPGLKRYFETYPYSCLEQKSSRAIALRDPARWQALQNEVETHLDSDGLASYFPPRQEDAARGSDRLTAYLIAAAHEAGWNWPDAARERMLQGLAAFVEGRLTRTFNAPRADLEMRKIAAIEALARHGRALPRLLGSINTAPAAVAQWPTGTLLDWWGVLKRVDGIPDRAARLAEVQNLLRARLVQGGSTLRLSTEENDYWWWLMDSPDGNAARLLLAAVEAPEWKDDVPRLVLGHLGRQKSGAWQTTTANLWSVLALERFSARFESTPVAGRTQLQFGATGAAAGTVEWAPGADPPAQTLAWPPAVPTTLVATHQGSGRPWLSVQTLAAVPLKAPLAAGYRITRTVSAVERKSPEAWSRGDIVRVRLEVEAVGDMAWVVVQDPLPAGAALLGGGLGRDSAMAVRGERREGAGWLAYEERGQDAWRAYYEWLPRGKHVAEYTMRLNNPGRFHLPPTRVEAMYAPETFGERPGEVVEVRP